MQETSPCYHKLPEIRNTPLLLSFFLYRTGIKNQLEQVRCSTEILRYYYANVLFQIHSRKYRNISTIDLASSLLTTAFINRTPSTPVVRCFQLMYISSVSKTLLIHEQIRRVFLLINILLKSHLHNLNIR